MPRGVKTLATQAWESECHARSHGKVDRENQLQSCPLTYTYTHMCCAHTHNIKKDFTKKTCEQEFHKTH